MTRSDSVRLRSTGIVSELLGATRVVSDRLGLFRSRSERLGSSQIDWDCFGAARNDSADRDRTLAVSGHGPQLPEIDPHMPADYSTFLVLGKLSPGTAPQAPDSFQGWDFGINLVCEAAIAE